MPRFKKGETGNPNGRSRRVLSEVLAARGLRKNLRTRIEDDVACYALTKLGLSA